MDVAKLQLVGGQVCYPEVACDLCFVIVFLFFFYCHIAGAAISHAESVRFYLLFWELKWPLQVRGLTDSGDNI